MAKAFSKEEVEKIKEMKKTMSYPEITRKTGASKSLIYRMVKDIY